MAAAKPKTSVLPVELKINGRVVQARPGQTILEVVREQKLDEIPTLCYDPGLEPFGSCFLCVVEVKGARGLLPSCTTRVRDGMEVVTRSDKIVRARKTALELLLSDHYADCVCPGQLACPAGVDVQGYLGLARLGHYREALLLIKERNPLPIVCGRVCVRKCELACRRGQVDEPVGINQVKRFLAEGMEVHPEARPPTFRSVAVVGGGPAGLTCAHYLALWGHAVTIFEAMPRLGGMLRYGIPEYRLPKAELDRDIDSLLALGVEVFCGHRLGRDITLQDLRESKGFDAVFVALGAPRGKALGVPGEEAAGVESALDFLKETELEGPRDLHGVVVVVGGGNSAVDAARTAIRSGAGEVIILYRRTRAEMPAHPEEVEAAEQEGVRLEMLAAPVELIEEGGNGRLSRIRCVRMELGEPDGSGRRRPVPVEGSQFDISCSFVLTAIGQETDSGAFVGEPDEGRPATGRGGTVDVDPGTMASSVPGVFAGGDLVSGPSAVVDAIAHGRRAAESIDGYLRTGRAKPAGREFVRRRDDFGPLPESFFEGVERVPRHRMPERAPEDRAADFDQVELGLAGEDAVDEAGRCLECGCRAQFTCDLRRYATEYGVNIGEVSGQVRRHRVDDSHPLIRFDPNKCILCGRCVRACAEVSDPCVLGFVGRGFDTRIQPTMGRAWAESPCTACGACIETCPTGALTAKLPGVRQGPWRAARFSSACTFCSLACPLDLNVVTDGLLWATSPEDAAPGQGDLCLLGRFGTGLIHGPDRIDTPLVRRDGRLVETSWKEALEEAGRLLGRCRDLHKAGSVAVLASARMTLEECYLVGRLARAGLGTNRLGSSGRLGRGGPRRDLDDWMGRTTSTCRLQDIDDADVVFLVGADPGVTHPVLAMRVRRAARRGADVVVMHSGQIDLVRSSRLWLDPRRGTTGMLLAEVLRRVLERGGIAGERMRVEGQFLQKILEGSTPGEVAAACGVDSGKLDRLAGMLLAGKKAVAVYDLDEEAERSTGDLALLARLLMASGHLHPPDGGLLLLQADCNSEGARLAGMDEEVLPGGHRLSDIRFYREVARCWGADLERLPRAKGESLAEAFSLGRIQGALILLEDPLGEPQGRAGFEDLEALVVVDHFLTRTGRAAQVVLPASTLVETEGTVVSFDRGLRSVEQACRPPGGRTMLQILCDLAAGFGHNIPSARPDVLRFELLRLAGISPEEAHAAWERKRWPDSEELLKPVGLDLEGIVVSSTPGMMGRRSHASMDEEVRSKLVGLEVPGFL